MPTYAYACTACDHRFEAVQSFSDDALTQCPECGGRLRKVFGSVGVVFKGSGFYRTDSRAGSGASGNGSGAAAKEPAKESAGSGDAGTSTPAKESKPSAPAPSSSSSSSGSSAA